jgi:hypothetical protein
VLTAHLIENEQRGDMSILGQGQRGRRSQGPTRRGEGHHALPATARRRDEGAGLRPSTPRHWPTTCSPPSGWLLWARSLPWICRAWTSRLIQPRLNGMKRHAQARASLAEDDLYAMVFEPVFRQTVDEYRRTSRFSMRGGVPCVRGGAGRGTRRACCRTAQGSRSGGTIVAGRGFGAGKLRHCRGGRGGTEGDCPVIDAAAGC